MSTVAHRTRKERTKTSKRGTRKRKKPKTLKPVFDADGKSLRESQPVSEGFIDKGDRQVERIRIDLFNEGGKVVRCLRNVAGVAAERNLTYDVAGYRFWRGRWKDVEVYPRKATVSGQTRDQNFYFMDAVESAEEIVGDGDAPVMDTDGRVLRDGPAQFDGYADEKEKIKRFRIHVYNEKGRMIDVLRTVPGLAIQFRRSVSGINNRLRSGRWQHLKCYMRTVFHNGRRSRKAFYLDSAARAVESKQFTFEIIDDDGDPVTDCEGRLLREATPVFEGLLDDRSKKAGTEDTEKNDGDTTGARKRIRIPLADKEGQPAGCLRNVAAFAAKRKRSRHVTQVWLNKLQSLGLKKYRRKLFDHHLGRNCWVAFFDWDQANELDAKRKRGDVGEDQEDPVVDDDGNPLKEGDLIPEGFIESTVWGKGKRKIYKTPKYQIPLFDQTGKRVGYLRNLGSFAAEHGISVVGAKLRFNRGRWQHKTAYERSAKNANGGIATTKFWIDGPAEERDDVLKYEKLRADGWFEAAEINEELGGSRQTLLRFVWPTLTHGRKAGELEFWSVPRSAWYVPGSVISRPRFLYSPAAVEYVRNFRGDATTVSATWVGIGDDQGGNMANGTEPAKSPRDRALEAYQHVKKKLDTEPGVEPAYEWIRDTGIEGYELPSLEVWIQLIGSTQKPLTEVKKDCDLPAPAQCAYSSFEFAEQELERPLTDRKAHNFLTEHGPDSYKLPNFRTWQRYVRQARNFHGTQKNTPRAGRDGRSIVSPADV